MSANIRTSRTIIRPNWIVGRKLNVLRVLIHVVALYPLCINFWLASQDLLGGDPVKAIIHFTGIGALNALLVSLLVSPLAKTCKQSGLMKLRRPLGLYAAFYATLHIVSYYLFDLVGDLSLLLSEIVERPYILVGAVALMLLWALSITSPNRVKRWCGRHWQTLHNYTYLVLILGLVHYLWSVKSDISQPLLYIGLGAILLVMRRDKFRRWLPTTKKHT